MRRLIYNNNKKRYMVGSCKHSDICVFSVHPVKTITTGEGELLLQIVKICIKLYITPDLLASQDQKKHWDYDVKKLV